MANVLRVFVPGVLLTLLCMFCCAINYVLLFAGSRPQLRDVHNLVTPDYAAHWRAIGTHLGLQKGLLDTIDHDNHHRAEDCCNAVWEEWFDMDTTASWSKVIEAIELPAVVSVVPVHKDAVLSDDSTQDSVPVLVTNAHNQLQEFYKGERYKTSEDDWPSYQPEHFTSVALIHHREKHVTTREVIAIANVMHKGKVNVGCVSEEKQQGSSYLQYYDSKISTNIAEIFNKLTSPTTQGDNTLLEQKVILIEGSPGIGKTILSREITFQWANNKLLKEKLLLFLIFLRDPYLQNIQTLEHFVCYAISSAQRNSMVTAVEQYLEETSGKHCMIVFDGYDEISEEVKCNSFISKIIIRKVLKLSSLVITSRPTTSACLHGIADRRVEILGFTKEDRNRYLHQSLGGKVDEIKTIEEYFEANPFIDSLCYIPLNMTILICLLKESIGPCTRLPKTQTEINKQFTFVTIARYLRRHHNHILTVKFLQSLPMPYKEQLGNLAKLAFVFLGKDKIVFNDNDVASDCPDCVGKWGSLGLLKVVEYSNLLEDSASFSYNFLHFSIQEFLAAFYIASLSNNKQIKILKSDFWNSKYLNMGIMYFGLSSGKSFALKHFLSGNKFVIFSKLFGANQIGRRVAEDRVKCLHLFQCFLEADNDKFLQKVSKYLADDTIDLSNSALLHKDIHILSFFLIRSANKTWKMLDLSGCYIGDQGFDIFTKSFAECSKNKTTIETVKMPYNHLTTLSINGIINLIFSFKVGKIILCNNIINYEVFDDKLLTNSIADNRVIKMAVEKVEGCELRVYFINYIFNVKQDIIVCKLNLKCNYYFWNANIRLCDIVTLTTGHHMHLTCLSVFEECLNSNEEAVSIASMLQQLCYLDQFYVEYVLQSNSSLFTFNTRIKKITQALKNEYSLQHEHQSNGHWKNVDLYHCSIRDTGFQAILSRFIKQDHIMYFDTFNISHCSLTELSINTILDLLKGCIIRKLIISDNSIPNALLHQFILNEICIQSKILNFKKQVSFTLFNNNEGSISNAGTEPVYSVIKYVVNCDIDDDTVTTARNLDNTFISYEVVLSNVDLLKNIEKIMVLCKSSFLNINIFQMSLSEEFQSKIVCALQNSRKRHYSYVLTSDSKLMAYKAKQNNITEAFNSKPDIHTLELIQCELDFSELSLLHPTLKSFPKQWNTIDLSECKIGDEGCNALCKSFIQSEGNINLLNLLNNGLTSTSASILVNLLQHCVIKKIILAKNETSENDIYTSLSTHYSSNAIMNFLSRIPLLIIVSVQHENILSCIYLIKSSFDSHILQKLLNKKSKLYHIFIVDDIRKKIHITVRYSDSCLRIHPIPSDSLGNLQEITKALKSKQTITSVDVSCNNCTDTFSHMLCNQLFNPKSVLKYIKQLNFSSNKLTASCLHSIIQSLQYCVVQQLLIFDNYVQNKEVTDVVTEYFSNRNICNFKLEIPFMVVNNSSIHEAGYTGILFFKKICNYEHILYKLLTVYLRSPITDYIIFFIHSDIMVDDLNDSLSILCSNLPPFTEIIIYEMDLSDEVAEKIAKILTKGFTKDIGFMLKSKTKLLVHKFFHKNITANLMTFSSINTLQITNCKLEPDQFKVMFSVGWKCKHIDLSGCHIGDEGLKLIFDVFLRSSNMPHISTLNISVNNLTSSSIRTIIKLLSHCIIEHLIISGNDIDDKEFNQALCIQYWNSIHVVNFVYAIPLVVRGTVLNKDITVCNTYITAVNTTNVVCSLTIDDSAQYYYIYYLNRRIRAVVTFKNKNMSGLIGPVSADLLPLVVNSMKFIFRRKFQTKIDFTSNNIDSMVFSILCLMIFNKHSLLRYVNTLTLSSNQLSVESMSKFVDCLQYCSFDFINIYEYKLVEKFSDLLFKRCCAAKRTFNTILQKPLTLINCTKVNKGAFIKHAITYFVNYKETTNFLEVIDSLLNQCDVETHKLVLFNFLSKNQTLIDLNSLQLVLQKSAIVDLIIYEVGLKDETASAIIDALQTIQERVEYVIASNTMFVVQKTTKDSRIFEAITNSFSIDTFSLKHCVLSQEALTHIGFVLSTKMNHLRRISLCGCYLFNDYNYQELHNGCIYQEFSKVFFHDTALIHYLKMLDISHNQMTSSCVNAIISSLQTCIVEKLVISDNEFNDELVNSIFVEGYYRGSFILNFINGVPLIIIKISQGDNSSTNCFTAFVVKCVVNECYIKLLSDILDYQDYHYNLLLVNSCIQREFVSYAASSLQYLIQKVGKFILFGTDLTDEMVITTSNCLCKVPQLMIEYFLVSDTKLITNLSETPSISSSKLIDIVGCSVGEEMFGMFCKSVFCEVGHITELDISAYQVTSVCVNILINSLQSCSIEKLTLVNYNNALDKVTDAMVDAYATEKPLQNFISGTPLKILGHTSVNKHTEVWISMFCINFYVNDDFEKRFADLLFDKNYARLKLVLINFIANNKRMILSTSKYLSNCLANVNNKVFLYEVGLQDEIATNIFEQLIAVQEQVQYVLVSPKMFLAYRVCANLIIKALADALCIPLLKLPAFTISTDESTKDAEPVLCRKFKYFRRISLSQCDVDDAKYNQFNGVLFGNIVISYLKELDISCSNLTSSCVSTIIDSLKSCIIEKLITANSINNEINNSLFTSAYYGNHDILNFIKGIPLFIIKRSYLIVNNYGNVIVNEKNALVCGWWIWSILYHCRIYYDDYSVQMDTISVFVVNAEVSNCVIKRITNVSEYSIYSYSLFLFSSNIITDDLKHCVSLFHQLLPMVTEFTLFGTDLSDAVAATISGYFQETSKTHIEYYLISETKLLSNMPKILPISRWLVTNPMTHIPGYNIGEEIFSMFCIKSLSNYPCFIKKVDISHYQLTSKCIQTLVDSLQYFCVEKLVIFNYGNKLSEITDAIFDVYHAGKTLRNSISRSPLVVIGHTKRDDHTESQANLYFVDFVANEKFEMMLCDFCADMNYSQLHCIFLNFFSSNEGVVMMKDKTLSSLLFNCCSNIYMYEPSLADKFAMEIVELLNTARGRVKYVLASKTILLAFRIDFMDIFGVLTKCPFISTIKLKSIKFYESLVYTVPYLSCKFKYLKALAITQSHIDDGSYEQLNKSLVNNRSVISYLKELDISHNLNFFSVKTLIKVLQCCIVERLIVPDKATNDDLSNAIFLKAYSKGVNIVNFLVGVPLTVINNVQIADGSPTFVGCLKSFLINTVVNEHTINVITDMSGQNVSHYNLFVKNNTLLFDLDCMSSAFELIMQNIMCLTLFGTDLMDEVALKIVHCLTKSAKTDYEYFLVSETKILTNGTTPTSTLSMLRALTYDDFTQIPDILEPTRMFYKSLTYSENLHGTTTNTWSMYKEVAYGEFKQIPNVLYELSGMFCKSLSYSENILKRFKCLDLSSYQFSSAYTKLLFDSLQFCCIEQLVLSGGSAKYLNDHILDGFCKGKRLCNTVSGIPLKVKSCTREISDSVSYTMDVYLVEVFVTDEVLQKMIPEENYKKLHYIILNASKNTCMLSNVFLSDVLEKSFCSLFICELGLQDEKALEIAEKLITSYQYVLASKALLLAYNTDMGSIIKALKCNPIIPTIKFTQCTISTFEFLKMVTAKFTHLRKISFSHCSVGGTTHKDGFVRGPIFSIGARILYLKQLDLSTSNCESLHLNTIIIGLQSCVIEKIILSDNEFNDELVNAIFVNAYYRRNYIVNFKMGVPLIVINIVQRKKSLKDVSNFTTFLMNAELNNVINTIIDVSGYDVHDYELFLIRNNVLGNSSNVFVQFQYLLLVLKSVTLFGTDLMEDLAWKIATYLSKISNLNIEFSLFCGNTSLTKVKNIQRILSIAKGGKMRNIIDTPLILSLTQGCQLDLIDISYCNIKKYRLMMSSRLFRSFCYAIVQQLKSLMFHIIEYLPVHFQRQLWIFM